MENLQRRKVRFHYAPSGNDMPISTAYSMSPETRQRFVDAVAEGFGYTILLQEIADPANPAVLDEGLSDMASDLPPTS